MIRSNPSTIVRRASRRLRTTARLKNGFGLERSVPSCTTHRAGWNHRGFQHRWEFELQDGRLVCRKADEVPGFVVSV